MDSYHQIRNLEEYFLKVKTRFNDVTGTNSMRTVYWIGKDFLNHPVSSGSYIVVLKGNGNKSGRRKSFFFNKYF